MRLIRMAKKCGSKRRVRKMRGGDADYSSSTAQEIIDSCDLILNRADLTEEQRDVFNAIKMAATAALTDDTLLAQVREDIKAAHDALMTMLETSTANEVMNSSAPNGAVAANGTEATNGTIETMIETAPQQMNGPGMEGGRRRRHRTKRAKKSKKTRKAKKSKKAKKNQKKN